MRLSKIVSHCRALRNRHQQRTRALAARWQAQQQRKREGRPSGKAPASASPAR